MNLLEILVILVTAVMCAWGYRRGFVRRIASIISLVASIALVSALLPYMTDFIKTNTPVYHYIEKQCRNVLNEQISEGLGLGQTQNPIVIDNYLDSWQPSRIEQTVLIEKLPIPEMLKDQMLDYNNEEGYRNLAVSNFTDYVVNYIATAILNVIAFIAAVIIVQILLRVALLALDILSHLPLIGGVNHFLGLVLGLLQTLFILWIFFMLLSMFSGTETGLWLMNMVQESTWLSWLYNSNLFLQIVLSAAVIFA